MDTAYIHLLINHLPVFGSILGAMVLVHGLYAKSDATKIAAYNIFTLSSIGAHRSPFLYRFDKRKYDKALKDGIALAF